MYLFKKKIIKINKILNTHKNSTLNKNISIAKYTMYELFTFIAHMQGCYNFLCIIKEKTNVGNYNGLTDRVK